MLFNVPQFIDIEDKIVGPLTAKQLGWIAAGAVVGLIFWATLEGAAFFLSIFFTGLVFGSLAFYRPYNQPLSKFIGSSVHFVMRPKVYIWKRYYDNMKLEHLPKINSEEKAPKRKTLNNQKLDEISEILDNK